MARVTCSVPHTCEEGLLVAVCRKAGREGGVRQGVVSEAERIVAWTRYHQGHLPIPELSGRGMAVTQNALEMKEVKEAKSPPGLGHLYRSVSGAGDKCEDCQVMCGCTTKVSILTRSFPHTCGTARLRGCVSDLVVEMVR